MLKSILSILILINIFILCFSYQGKMLGPAIFSFRSFEHCDPPKTDIDVWVTQKKFNRSTSVLEINLTTPLPLDDEITLEVICSIKKEGGYKPGSFYMKDSFCVVLKTLFKDVFQAFLDIAGVEDCPIPVGTYKADNFYLDGEKMSDLLYGDYKTQINMFLNEELKGCYMAYVDVEPKDE